VRVCPACGEELIYLRNLRTQSVVPLNAASVKDTDTIFVNVRHVSHFTTCPDIDRFVALRLRGIGPCRELSDE
jgi:hypothetical protein